MGSSVPQGHWREWPDPETACETCQDEPTKGTVLRTSHRQKGWLPAAVGVAVGCREEMTWGGLGKNIVCKVLGGLWECVNHNGVLRERTKGGEREGPRWAGEEQAWQNRGKRG